MYNRPVKNTTFLYYPVFISYQSQKCALTSLQFRVKYLQLPANLIGQVETHIWLIVYLFHLKFIDLQMRLMLNTPFTVVDYNHSQ